MHLAGLNFHMLRWLRLPGLRSALIGSKRCPPGIRTGRCQTLATRRQQTHRLLLRRAYGNLSSAICPSYFSTVPYQKKEGFYMLICTCEHCRYIFRYPLMPSICPDCGSKYIRKASNKEMHDYYRIQKILRKEIKMGLYATNG